VKRTSLIFNLELYDGARSRLRHGVTLRRPAPVTLRRSGPHGRRSRRVATSIGNGACPLLVSHKCLAGPKGNWPAGPVAGGARLRRASSCGSTHDAPQSDAPPAVVPATVRHCGLVRRGQPCCLIRDANPLIGNETGVATGVSRVSQRPREGGLSGQSPGVCDCVARLRMDRRMTRRRATRPQPLSPLPCAIAAWCGGGLAVSSAAPTH
jgi:hypothetical protein